MYYQERRPHRGVFLGTADGIQTHDLFRCFAPKQASGGLNALRAWRSWIRDIFNHTKKHPSKEGCFLVRPTGFEPTPSRVGVWHSIQLSYGRIFFLLQLYKGKRICYNGPIQSTGIIAD